MDAALLIQQAGPAVATFLVSLVGAVVPCLSTEVFLVAVVAFVPADCGVWRLGVVAALGQMAGKSALYWSSAAAARCRRWHRADRGRLVRLQRRLAAMNALVAAGFTFVSATSGVPPFILVSLIAGAGGVRFGPFLIAGFAGRSLRMVAVVLGAAAVRAAAS
jgi:membrane protein YqaA with SNARE-associated domain